MSSPSNRHPSCPTSSPPRHNNLQDCRVFPPDPVPFSLVPINFSAGVDKTLVSGGCDECFAGPPTVGKSVDRENEDDWVDDRANGLDLDGDGSGRGREVRVVMATAKCLQSS